MSEVVNPGALDWRTPSGSFNHGQRAQLALTPKGSWVVRDESWGLFSQQGLEPCNRLEMRCKIKSPQNLRIFLSVNLNWCG
jgi:hypothetical protein